MSAPPSLPRVVYFNKETRQPNPSICEADSNHIGYEVLDNDPYHFLELKEDQSGWQYNDAAEAQRLVTADAMRKARQPLLMATDYVPMMADGDKKQHMLAYRQWLRDLPQRVLDGTYQPAPCISLEYDPTKCYE